MIRAALNGPGLNANVITALRAVNRFTEAHSIAGLAEHLWLNNWMVSSNFKQLNLLLRLIR
jgi:hypothetical protein